MTNTADGSLGGSSFAHGSSKRSFDVRKEGDVLELLRVVHLQALDPQIKNHLRDLIFTYRQTRGTDEAKLIEQSFAPLGFSIVFTDFSKVAAVKPEAPVQGFARPMPRFTPASIALTSTNTPQPQTAEEPVEYKAVVPTVVPQTVVPEPAASVVVPEEKIPATSPLATATAGGSSTQATERIKEIKRLVNEKVGNPVNLMDTHTEIGREYMNALLDAMKKTNGAQPGELQAAMVRLEAAFKTVQEITVTDEVKAIPQTEAAPAQKTEGAFFQEIPKKSTPQPVVTAPSYQEEVVTKSPQAPLSVSGEGSAVPIRFASVQENIAVHTKDQAPAQTAMQALQDVPSNKTESPSAIHSVAKEKQLQELLRLNKQKEAQSKVQAEEIRNTNTDPLQSAEVTAGLNQLLSEWGLFKSSGLFGTGPNGKDHPLFKKLESLTMAAVIAGRFEGATPVIKQSITDYMNGWRYEEGIVHDHTETFEHYLRKVVAHILNRKKNG